MTYTQSNLDLRQYLADGTEILPPAAPSHGGGPDAIDPDDTVEQVRAPAGGPHGVIYKVEAASTVEGLAAEPFAVTAVDPLTPLEPAVVAPTASTSDPGGPVRCGQPITIRTSLVNDSDDLSAEAARVAVELPSGVAVVDGVAEQQVSGRELEAGADVGAALMDSRGDERRSEAGHGCRNRRGARNRFPADLPADAGRRLHRPRHEDRHGPERPDQDAAPAFSFSASGGGTRFECSVDEAAFATCSSPTVLGGIGEGSHSFAVRAVDEAGNADPSPASRAFTVDRAVAGAILERRSRRIAGGGRRLGAITVGLGEPGVVRVGASAVLGEREIDLRDRRIRFAGPGRGSVRLLVVGGGRRAVRRAARSGRSVPVRVETSFSDGVGNRMAGRTLRFRAR